MSKEDVFQAVLTDYLEPRVEGYTLVRPIADGGEARVYLARDARGREVALKRWLSQPGPEERARIEREARALERAAHPNLVGFVELTRDQGGAPVIALELIEGTSLAELIRQAGRLAPGRAVALGVALADALAHLHALGLVHRDVKPANVIVRHSDDQPVLLDLGVVSDEREPGRAALAGSFPYMAPEQLGAEAPEAEAPEVDARADVYGLGALLFHALTGWAPWTDQGAWERRERAPFVDPVHPEVRERARDLPVALRELVSRCLAGDPAARFSSAAELCEALRALSADDPELPGLSAERGRRALTLAAFRVTDEAQVPALRRRLSASATLEFRTRGRELLASFPGPSSALRFALGLLKAPELDAPAVGLHFGEVQEHPPAGVVVTLVERLAALAEPGQVLMSSVVFDEARQHLEADAEEEIAWRAYGPYAFQKVEGEARGLQLCEAGYPSRSPLRPPPDGPLVRRSVKPGHEVTLGWRPAAGLRVPQRENWVLVRKLGEGGFGEVWLAQHASTRDQRAFKFCFHAERLRQLKREVILFRVLRDTLDKRWDITQLLDWQFEQAPFFIESEYTPNGSFLDWARAEGGLSEVAFEQRLELMAQVADALSAAHGVGVLHKDVKPSNVLITSYGLAQTAQLADFGVGTLASRERLGELRGVEDPITGSTLTEVWATTEAHAFSHLYVAPELLEGKAASPASDLYALGVMLYQVVRGDFSRALGPGWERHVDDALLREDIGACVDSDPNRRLATARVLAERLRTLDERREQRDLDERAREREALLQRQRELLVERRKWAALLAAAIAALFAVVWVQRGRLVRLEGEKLQLEAEARATADEAAGLREALDRARAKSSGG